MIWKANHFFFLKGNRGQPHTPSDPAQKPFKSLVGTHPYTGIYKIIVANVPNSVT